MKTLSAAAEIRQPPDWSCPWSWDKLIVNSFSAPPRTADKELKMYKVMQNVLTVKPNFSGVQKGKFIERPTGILHKR